jgi:hypothetical protein
MNSSFNKLLFVVPYFNNYKYLPREKRELEPNLVPKIDYEKKSTNKLM